MAVGQSRSRNLRRTIAFRPVRRTFVLFCEGGVSEPQYLRALRGEASVHENSAIEIRNTGATTVPLALVQLAVEAKDRAASEQAEIDEFWCVFDVEWPTNHPNLAEAIALAAKHGIKLAISNPCFELWLLLHDKDQTGWLSTDDAEAALAALRARSKPKHVDGSFYIPSRRTAFTRAKCSTVPISAMASTFLMTTRHPECTCCSAR